MYAIDSKHIVNDQLSSLFSSGQLGQGNESASLRKSVNNYHDGSVTLGWWKSSNKIHREVRPGSSRYRERMGQTLR